MRGCGASRRGWLIGWLAFTQTRREQRCSHCSKAIGFAASRSGGDLSECGVQFIQCHSGARRWGLCPVASGGISSVGFFGGQGFRVVALHVAMLHDLCHCTHNQVSGSSSGREEDMMNDMASDLTQSQQDTLSKFREILAEQGLLRKRDDDHTLLRFLRARGFDIAKAKSMYEAMLDWREEIGADTIRETFEFPERKAIRDLYPHFHHKTDKLGRPVYIERLGQLNVDELLKITTMDRMLLYHVKEWEVLVDWKFPACSKQAGTNVSQSLTILDLKGVTMKHMSKQVRHFIQKITKVDQDYYPEYLGKMFIVNAPTAFKAIWAMIKPWLDKRTQKKIELHGGHFSSKLLELVDSENLPEFLGGSCNCLGGCENSDTGPWNEALYSSDALYDEPVKAAA